ncbi:MAG: TrkH family potassium uptake protein [Myxococcales bacterium]|nr:MAG: TrkH family potassium uptake protein [Myxococcales bacterium]
MRVRLLFKLLGALNAAIGATMLLPLALALADGTPDASAFAIALGVTVAAGAAAYLANRRVNEPLSHRDGFLLVGLAWITACFFGALPFWFSGYFGHFTNAYFESVSGYTTTGSTILADIAAVPRASLFWRSLIQWIGGMGIIVLSLAILPMLGVGGMQLFKAEVPGPTTDKLQPHIRDTAAQLWKVYVIITAAEIVLLMLGGMDWFEAVCHSFTTLATGGFGTRPDSFMSTHSAFLDGVTTFFMILAGVNFSLHYLALKGDWRSYLRDGEFKVYLTILAAATLILAAFLRFGGLYSSLGEALRHAAFQAVAIVTTTGYNSADFEAWGAKAPLAPLLLFVLMFVGGSAGSTGGSIKVIRLWLVLKHGYRELFRLIHPRAVKAVKVGNRTVPEPVLDAVASFFGLYIVVFVAAAMMIASFGHDLVTSFSAAATALGNVGPGLGTVGPLDNFDHLQIPVKWVLIACMLLGRLELYTLLVLFVPEFWRK